jgi:hypothetical protein
MPELVLAANEQVESVDEKSDPNFDIVTVVDIMGGKKRRAKRAKKSKGKKKASK